jgi:hypothetical protein
MRIGRNLTITDIDTYITNYISNYKLTEAQIAEIIANASGAIGCLSYLLGIDSNKVPVLCLTTQNKVVPHGAWTKLIWDAKVIDNLNAWNVSVPEEVNIRNSGVYEAFVYAQWALNTVGNRKIWLYTYTPYLYECVAPALTAQSTRNCLGFVSPIEIDEHAWVYVEQNSGGDLTIDEAVLVLHRKAFQTFTY